MNEKRETEKPRFELLIVTDGSSRVRSKHANEARTRCASTTSRRVQETGAFKLHESAGSNTSRRGHSTSPAAESTQPKTAVRFRRLKLTARKLRLQRIARLSTLRQAVAFRSGRPKKGGIVCTTRTGRNGRRQKEKMHNRRLRQGAIVGNGRYDNGGVLHAACTGWNGQRQVQNG